MKGGSGWRLAVGNTCAKEDRVDDSVDGWIDDRLNAEGNRKPGCLLRAFRQGHDSVGTAIKAYHFASFFAAILASISFCSSFVRLLPASIAPGL